MKKTLLNFINAIKSFFLKTFHKYHPKLPYILTVILALIVGVGSINLFIELTETLKTKVLATYDEQITQYIISYRTPALTNFFKFMTNVGDLYGYLTVIVICAIISFFIYKRWKFVVETTIVLLLASVSNMVLKRFINRARPGIEHLVSVETLSYPSGHAMSAMAFYGFIIYLFYKFKMNKFLKYGVIVFLVLLILSIGLSRIYLGVHYPSDIAGGFIAGFIWVIFCVLLFNLLEVFKQDPST